MDVSKQLPREGKYVLVHLKKYNWKDSTDQLGVCFKVAKLKKGISADERERMQRGEIPDPDILHLEVGYGGNVPTKRKRSSIIQEGDEWFNNFRPYCWSTFGPSSYCGQEVDFWMEIPSLAGGL